MLEFEIYHSIVPSEFTNQGWMKGTKEEKETNAPNVIQLIDRFNQVSNWVATTIIFENDLETRRDMLVYFIHLANKCRELHNFNAMMEGWNHSPKEEKKNQKKKKKNGKKKKEKQRFQLLLILEFL